MAIPDRSHVHNIEAGAITFALPLAVRGCPITVVEPFPVMREALAERINKEDIQNTTIIPEQWGYGWLEMLGERYDVVIASYSLARRDIAEAIAKMSACCKGTVHLFWLLTPHHGQK